MFKALGLKGTEREWLNAFQRSHPELFAYDGESDKLRLILGVGRSGTSWLSRVLSKSTTPLRFFNEPLHPFRPKLPFSNKYDHTAVPYCRSLGDDHPLVRVYKCLTLSDYDWDRLLPGKIICRDDRKFSFCLVKEVHALLATEALLKKLQCATLFITRDPVYVVDSLLSFRRLNAPIWQNESRYVRDGSFLVRYFPEEAYRIQKYYGKNARTFNKKKRIIMNKMLTVGIINKMLSSLADELDFVCHIRYEELCEDPEKIFKKAADFLSLDMEAGMLDYLSSTQKKNERDIGPYSIYRDTSQQLRRPLRFISDTEAEMGRTMLLECALI
ncbi:MAG: sulfotransferase [Desulfobacterales bacterium]|nr:sulfotransferase [Desulfobacterales bacterium]